MHIGKRRGMCKLRVRVGSVRVGKLGEKDVVYIVYTSVRHTYCRVGLCPYYAMLCKYTRNTKT